MPSGVNGKQTGGGGIMDSFLSYWFGGGLWTRTKTKAEYEAERMNRMKKVSFNNH